MWAGGGYTAFTLSLRSSIHPSAAGHVVLTKQFSKNLTLSDCLENLVSSYIILQILVHVISLIEVSS